MNETLCGAPVPLTGPTARWSVGGLFIEALTKRDFAAMADCFEADVRLRALLPPGPVEVTGRDRVVEWFRCWFGGTDELELVDATLGEVGPRLYVRWRVGLSPTESKGSRNLIEQHAFATTGDHISALDLLCSGFVPQPAKFDSDKEVVWLERQ